MSIPRKFSSFTSSSGRDDKHRPEMDRSLSLSSVKLEKSHGKKGRDTEQLTIEEEEEEEEEKEKEEEEEATKEDEEASNSATPELEVSFASLLEGIDDFVGVLFGLQGGPDQKPEPPAFPEPRVKRFLEIVKEEVVKLASSENGLISLDDNEQHNLFDSINRVAKLTSALKTFSSDPKYNQAMNRGNIIIHHAMCFLEDEFHALLEDSKSKREPGSARSNSKRGRHHSSDDRCMLSSSESESGEVPLTYPPEIIEQLTRIAGAMISAGYVTECCQVFTIARRKAFDTSLSSLGYEKIGSDDVLKITWEALEAEIATWIKVFRQAVDVDFPREHDLCDAVFTGHSAIAYSIFHNFARGITIPLLTFAEAVTMTRRSAEKLFKVLDMYETLRDTLPLMDALLRNSSQPDEPSTADDLLTEISSVRSRLGEAAVAIFCDLESSIKNDMGKTTVPGGAVHPLTRYVMNYVKYACEYNKTMGQVFRDHKNAERPSSHDENGEDAPQGGGGGDRSNNISANNSDDPFSTQLVEMMDLLHSNLEAKSKMYRDPALSNIFLMNNGRYIMQKIKGSSEVHQLLGHTWGRKRSSELRQYHKNYQRETWSKVLACFKDDGLLQSKGHVVKPALKERFKSFNSMFEEIHKTQSGWVVSDEQLQSELRVSVSAVIVPAYRSFLGRFSQHLDHGRQTEKYIKFGPEELENYIDEFFSGNASSMVSRKRI